ncbi:MAG TPA: NAD(P)-dependent oxidoreductase [Candidatus Omnitrophota bacterium]|nr:NAD(P)-dependent oxidoreductase [Candidatus Omnitrophota bacterium]
MSKKVLVTGGLGFIGHHLSPYLAERGHKVVVLDNFYHHITDERYHDFIKQRIAHIQKANIPIESADSRHADTVLALLEMHEPDTIVHLAATANAGLCNINPSEGVDMGLRSFCGMLNAVKKFGKKVHVIYSSSSMIYGNFVAPVVEETQTPNPINIYGASKFSCEIFAEAYGRVSNMLWTIMRPSALYGPRCINRRVTQIFIENVLDGKPLKLANAGELMLDFTDVRDLSQGIALIVENPEKCKNEIFNITYGEARATKDLLPILKSELGDFKYDSTPLDPHVPKRGTLNVLKIKNTLGYKPKYPIEIGYRDMIRWYKEIKWGKK